MRGDVELGDFKAAPGLRDVFVTEMTQRAESVFERSTLRTLEPKMSAAEVETTLMSYHQDEKNGRLYVHTSDSLPPACHALGASATDANDRKENIGTSIVSLRFKMSEVEAMAKK